MYLTLSRLDFILSLVLFPAWLAAALTVRRLASLPTAGRLRRGARIALVVTALASLLALARLFAFSRIAAFGWVFVGDRRMYTTLLLLLPGFLATLGWSFPHLWATARRRVTDRTAAVPAAERARFAAPRRAFPPQLAAFGSLGGFFEKFLPPNRPVWLNLLVYGAILVVGAALLARRARIRASRVSGTAGAPQRSRGRTLAVRLGTTVVVSGAIAALVATGIQSSTFPDTFSMMQGPADYGGGPSASHGGHPAGHHGMAAMPGASSVGTVSVNDLKTRGGIPDRRFTLTAQEKKIRLASGRTVDAWAFNGQIPGPELRVKQGELVAVTLVNRLSKDPVSIHWHGMDVPNGEDGVAGVTQNAVQPGASYTYRFKVGESGSRWYHSHQQGSEQISRGLFGPLVIDPAAPRSAVDQDVTVIAHDWKASPGVLRPSFGTSDVLDRRRVRPGDRVRLRLMNTSNLTRTFTLTGTPFRVTALDGTDLNEPGELNDRRLVLAAAGRMDLEFTMPATPVRLVDLQAPEAGIAFSADGKGSAEPKLDGPEFDKTSYGESAATSFGPDSKFDRNFTLVTDDWLGFYDGVFGLRQTVNGRVFPDTPMLMVREGDMVRTRFVNRGEEDHPMHLHGHHMLLLRHNGKTLTGSPVWQDTVLVRPGEEWEVAFKADNPGIWMDHCHNFVHTALGMMLHLSYEGVTTPYRIGGTAGNLPE
ncbi:multicopper oxidase family protein [Streptomyces sp. NBC_01618]|uniref:multicopper oxidase family protein n=1 Tax=Streptomyces sp. NBC_01618 TaxID=2975900 RepID=UPI0038656309|nr:multicopper oxidase family protein [Streptomyces sp. NBC_01618]